MTDNKEAVDAILQGSHYMLGKFVGLAKMAAYFGPGDMNAMYRINKRLIELGQEYDEKFKNIDIKTCTKMPTTCPCIMCQSVRDDARQELMSTEEEVEDV
jgi:hypothetical protein